MYDKSVLVSIVIPIYNVENYLDKCIESVVEQSYKNLDIILVDDGSTDSSREIRDLWETKDERIKVIHKKNGGLSSARNTGINIAIGEYIAFIDSDDYIDSEYVTRLLNKMIETNSDIVCCGYYEIVDGKTTVPNKRLICGEYEKKEALERLLKWDIQDYAWNKLYRRVLFSQIRYPNGRNFEDMATTYKTFLKANKVCVVNDRLYNYLIRKGSISNTEDYVKHIKDMWDTIETYNERISEISVVYPEFKILTIEQMMDRIDFFLNTAICKDTEKLASKIKNYVKPYVKSLWGSNCVSMKRKFKIFMMYMCPRQYISIKLRIREKSSGKQNE